MAELYLSDGSEFSKIPLITETVTTDTNLDNHNKTGYYVVKGVPSTGGNDFSPVSQWVSVFTDSDIGTPFQIAIPDGSNPYLYKRSLANNSWNKLYAGYADSAGSANTANSATTANSANVANTAAASGNLVSQAFSALVTVPCNAPQATINVNALSATSVRIANIIVVKIA